MYVCSLQAFELESHRQLIENSEILNAEKVFWIWKARRSAQLSAQQPDVAGIDDFNALICDSGTSAV